VPRIDYSVTQEIAETLLKEGHPELVVKSITKSIARLEERILNMEIEMGKKVTDTGAWRTVSVKLMNRRDSLIGKLSFGLGIPAAIGLLGLLFKLAWKGLRASKG
jgi:hypothetical protein